jgi:WD40 repeat protein
MAKEFLRIILSMALLSVALITPVLADADFEFNAKGMTLRNSVGRTLVGVTRDRSNTWSVYLSKSGEAHFKFSSGSSKVATYRLIDSYILCFKGLMSSDKSQEICKRAEQVGRGIDWMTVNLKMKDGKITWERVVSGEITGTSQMVYSFSGRSNVDQSSYISDVSKWAGHVIVGRTLKDKEAWFAILSIDGKVEFVFGSGRKYNGYYTLSKKEICMTFPDNPAANGCRRPTVKGSKVIWVSSDSGGAISELVFMKDIEREGPRRALDEIVKDVSDYSLTPNRKIIIATANSKDELFVIDAATNQKIGSIESIEPQDIEFSADSSLMGVAYSGGVEIFALESGAFLSAVEVPQFGADVAEIAFFPDSDEVLIGDKSGRLLAVNWKTGALLRETQFGAEPIVGMAINRNGLIGIATASGAVAVLDAMLQPMIGLAAQALKTFNGVTMTGDGRYFIAASEDKNIYLFDLSQSADVKQRSARMPGFKLFSVDASYLTNRAVVSFGTSLAFVSLPDLKLISTWKNIAERRIDRASYLENGTDIMFMSRNNGIEIWSADVAAAQRIKKYAEQMDVQDDNDLEKLREKFETFSGNSMEYHIRRAESVRLYNEGDCAAYKALHGDLRLADRRNDCDANVELIEIVKKFKIAITQGDCELAESLSEKVSIDSRDLIECFKKVQKEAYIFAKEAKDCAVVRDLSAIFGEPEAGSDCELSLVLSDQSSRVMYLAGIKLDASGDHARSKQIYLEIMTRFPEDDLAIDAANRLIALTDFEKADKAQAQAAAETTAAIKAAEARAAAAELAAKKAANEVKEQSLAREAEARRADKARRDAVAAQQRAQQPRRKSACDRVYIGMEFKGGMFGIFRYRVQGLNAVTGRVTIREVTGGGSSQEISCSQVP